MVKVMIKVHFAIKMIEFGIKVVIESKFGDPGASVVWHIAERPS